MIVAALVGMAAEAGAQPLGGAPRDQAERREPVIAAGLTVGRSMLSEVGGGSEATWSGSLQVGIGRRFVLEGQVSRWLSRGQDLRVVLASEDINRLVGQPVAVPGPYTLGTARREATSFNGNLLVRAGSPRVTGLAGGGFGVQRTDDTLSGRIEACPPTWCITLSAEPTVIRRWRGVAQVAGGADVALGRGLFAVGSIRWQLAPEAGLEMTGGARVALRSRPARTSTAPARQAPPPAPAAGLAALEAVAGRDVRVIETGGSRRTGRLLGVTAASLTLRRGGEDVVVPLASVQRVETEPHHARNLAILAAIGGFFGGWLGSCGTGDEEDCWPEVGLMVAGIGAGAGLGIGAMMNSASRRVLFERPTASVSVAPLGSGRRVGALVAVRW
jgi:hypothetical protein